jgi:hypothetical protein
MAKVIGPHVPRRRRLHRDHRTVYRLSLARDLVDLPFRPLPESIPMRLMHLLAAPPEQRPHPPAPIAGMALGQFVDWRGRVGVGIGTSLVAEGRALQRQQDPGPALRKPPSDQGLGGLTPRRHGHDFLAGTPSAHQPPGRARPTTV